VPTDLKGKMNKNSKIQITNFKQITMTKIKNSKPVYDLEERTFQFAKSVRFFVKTSTLEKSK
jgi:hypothetical protein